MAENLQPIIIIKKKVNHGGHHGGAWKVAYADFVTAMMALFIVLWLLNSSEQVRKAVSAYFQDPKNVDARGNLGVLLFFQGEYSKATPQLREAIALRPGLWKLQALLGMSEKRIGEIAAARTDLDASFPHLEEEKLRVQAWSGADRARLFSRRSR
jgi:flagellar motor protein MotB